MYGPNNFPQKLTFIKFLSWIKVQIGDSTWIMGGEFNMITSMGENKGGRRIMDRFQEAFRDFLEQSQLVDMETGNKWYTWNNRRGGMGPRGL